jgi:hypothetical protein
LPDFVGKSESFLSKEKKGTPSTTMVMVMRVGRLGFGVALFYMWRARKREASRWEEVAEFSGRRWERT